jgi:hypothetical protein
MVAAIMTDDDHSAPSTSRFKASARMSRSSSGTSPLFIGHILIVVGVRGRDLADFSMQYPHVAKWRANDFSGFCDLD